MTMVTADAFFAGVIAGLSVKNRRSVSIATGRFDRAMQRAAERLQERADEYGLEVDFRIRPHPIHGTSSTVRECLSAAVQSDIISLDNPEYQDLRIKVDADEADAMFKWLPGDRDLYMDLATEFLAAYAASAA